MTIVCGQCNHRFEAANAHDPAAADAVCPRCGATVDVRAQVDALASRTTDAGDDETSYRPPSSMDGRSLGDYEIIEEISRGAMGVVYKARHRSLRRVVALKVMIAGEHASPEQVRRFEKEARAAAKLRHPNIVPIYEIGTEDGKRFFTMDFIEGTPLDVLIARKQLSPRHALEIGAEVADALAYAHSRGVIHRDIKPSNILIDAAGRPQITDFGLAKQLDTDSKFTRTGTTIGTPSYMSPEQARGENTKVDQRSDVYSLGAVMYEMLTGRPPFTGETMMNIVMKVIHDDPVPLRRLNPRTHRDLQTIVLKAMEKEPHRRYQRMEDLSADIRRYLAGEMIAARPAGPLRRLAKTARKYRSAIVVGLVIAFLVSGVSGAIIHILIRRQAEAQRRAREAELERLAQLKEVEPEWDLEFRDDFSRPKLDPAWVPGGKGWSLEDRWLAVRTREPTYIALRRTFEGTVRIEFTARAQTADARINCFLGGSPRAGYSFRFGNWNGHHLTLRRTLGRRPKLLAQVAAAPIQPKTVYRFRIERRGTSLVYRVTGGGRTEELRYDDPELLRDLGKIRFGFDTWGCTLNFDDVKISREVYAGERLNILQFIDYSIYSRGLLEKALAEYKEVMNKHRDKPIAVIAEYHCGLIQEALGTKPEFRLGEALRHYRNVVRRGALLEGKHRGVLDAARQRIFFVLVYLGRYKEAARELAAFCKSGRTFDIGSVWKFPAVLSRCAGDLAFDPALVILEQARFDRGNGGHLRDLWEMTGRAVRANFAKALNEICTGFLRNDRTDKMKRAVLALPSPGAAPAFERAVAKAMGKRDVPAALDLLAFAARHGMRTSRLERSASELAQRFFGARQYERITSVHKAYPAAGPARYLGRALHELIRAGRLEAAEAMLEYARTSRALRPTELARPAGELAAKFAGSRQYVKVLELAEKYPGAALAGPFAAAMQAVSATDRQELLERLMTSALTRYPSDPRVAAAARGVARTLIEAGEADAVLDAYETAAQEQGKNQEAAAGLLAAAGRELLAGKAFVQAVAAYRGAVRAAADLPAVAAPALARTAVLLEFLGETEEAGNAWDRLIKKYPEAAEATVAKFLTGELSKEDFEKWAARNAKRLSPAERTFYLGLSAMADGDPEDARKRFEGAMNAARKDSWVRVLAEAVLARLPAPEVPPEEP